jgi:hypothetical protein
VAKYSVRVAYDKMFGLVAQRDSNYFVISRPVDLTITKTLLYNHTQIWDLFSESGTLFYRSDNQKMFTSIVSNNEPFCCEMKPYSYFGSGPILLEVGNNFSRFAARRV